MEREEGDVCVSGYRHLSQVLSCRAFPKLILFFCLLWDRIFEITENCDNSIAEKRTCETFCFYIPRNFQEISKKFHTICIREERQGL